VRNAMGVREEISPLFRLARGQVFLDLIFERLGPVKHRFSKVLVGLLSADLDHARYLASRHRDFEVEFVKIARSTSAQETILQLLSKVESGSKVCLQLGDTVVDFPMDEIDNHNFGILVDLDEGNRTAYEAVFLDATKRKASPKADEHFETPATHIGFYWFTSDKDVPKPASDNFIDFIFGISKDSSAVAVVAQNWIDSDRSDKFSEAQDPTFESRSFNVVTLSKEEGTVVKRSSDVGKLNREYQYIRSLPPSVSALFPSVRDYDATDGVGQIVMDYWPFPNLSDLYCFDNLPESFWADTFQRISAGLSRLHATKPDGESGGTQDLTWPFIEKTLVRLESLESNERWPIDVNRPLSVNDVELESPISLVGRARQIIENVHLQQCLVHGDFCFSNILIDPTSLVLKFLDPRGGFNEAGHSGPDLYDYGKVAHSLFGDYDLILKGFCRLIQPSTRDAQTWELTVTRPAHSVIAIDASIRYFFKSKKLLALSRLAGGLILMSIPPLHLENVERATAFFLRGMEEAAFSLKLLEKVGDWE